MFRIIDHCHQYNVQEQVSKYTLEKGKVIRVERDTGVTGRLLTGCMHTHSHHLCIDGDA